MEPTQYTPVCRSRQGDGERTTPTRSAPGIEADGGVVISRVSAIVCAGYAIELSELSRRGSRHPARAAMAYLAQLVAHV
jgi:hypothetical protein